jgi:hypothetical protein
LKELAMLARMKRIRRVFGTEVFVRILILLIGAIGMSIGGWIFLSSVVPAEITVGCFTLGWILRKPIAARIESIPVVVKICLSIYALVLLGSKRLELDHITQLSIITGTTVLIFNLQFWSRSDPGVDAMAMSENEHA